MPRTKPRKKNKRGRVKEFHPNEQKIIDKTAVETLNSGSGKRLTKTGKQ